MRKDSNTGHSLDWLARLPSGAPVPEPGHAMARYEALQVNRGEQLEQARWNAHFTIPSLMPDTEAVDRRYQPWHSIGAEGVSHLASKFSLTLFPPQGAFFKFEPDALLLRRAQEQAKMLQAQQAMEMGQEQTEAEMEEAGKNFVAEADAAAAAIEQAIMREFDLLGCRSNIMEAFMQLLIAGNALLYLGEHGAKVFPLDRYVVNRDPEGTVTEIVVLEKIDRELLPEKLVKAKDPSYEAGQPGKQPDDDVEIYTYVKFDYNAATVYWWQEAYNEVVDGTLSVSPLDGCPWIPIRFTTVHGEDYGLSFVRMVRGDLELLNGLSLALAQGYINSVRLIYLIRPGSGITNLQLKNANQGDVLSGDPAAVGTLQSTKNSDLGAAVEYSRILEQRVQRMFGMPISVQRKGERVSASEFTHLAQSLEAASTGFYSIFAAEVQPKIVTRLLHILQRKGRLDPAMMLLPTGEKIYGIKPITGLAALGRNDDLQRLQELIQVFGQIFGPDGMPRYVNMSELAQRLANALAVNQDNLIYTPQEIAEKDAEAQAQAQAQQQAEMDRKEEVEMSKAALASPLSAKLLEQQMQQNGSSILPEGISPTAFATRQPSQQG